jgi:hypothetical protein
MTAYPTFGDNSSRVKPDDPKYAEGFLPGDVLPAEWLNWLLNRGSSATTKLNAGTLSMEQEINNVLAAGNQTPDATQTNQLITAINYIINQVRIAEQQRIPVGVPTLWMGPKPEWALDFGNGAASQYVWANYPKLNNQKFWDILDTLSSAGWMAARDSSGFYVPDLRGIVPIGYGTNAKRTGETTAGGNMGQYLASTNKSHYHDFTHYHNRGGMEIVGKYTAAQLTYDGGGYTASGALYHAGYGSNAGTEDSNGVSRIIGLQASRSWTGITSVGRDGADTYNITNTGAQGGTSKPPTIGCMWIVRFD